MAILPEPFAALPRALLVTLGVSATIALATWLWLARRFVRGLFRRPQRRLGLVGYLLALLIGLGSGFVAVAALALMTALAGYSALSARARVAEVQCVERAPQRLRVYYVALAPDGLRGPTQIFDVDGDEWSVGGEVLRFRPALVALGLRPLHAVTRVEGRWQRADDANRHTGTAHDLLGGSPGAWHWLKRFGTRGPLRWVVDGVHGQSVSQLPDPTSTYDVLLTPNGYVLDQHAR